MPRPGPRRPIIALRLDADTIEWLDSAAQTQGVTRSELVRTIITRQRTREDEQR